MIKDYIIKERLGIGSYGTVYKAKKKNSNQIYVIKQISLLGVVEQQINEYKLEASILSSIKSKYVVKYYDSFEENNFLNIVMEYCDGGDLYQYMEEKKKSVKLLKENIIWELFIKMILGLSSIHKKKILHRDLKAQNIFLTKNLGVKIGDLGVAKKLNQTNFAKTFIGTPFYLSPELCSEKPYNDKSDIWALGCILYELCTFKHPFNAKSQGALILKILNSTPERINQIYSRDLQKMIDLLLNKNYLQRPSCNDILKMPIVLLKAKKYNLIGEILNENSKTNFYIDLDDSTFIPNKERKTYNDGRSSKRYYNLNQNTSNEDKNKDIQISIDKNKINKKNENLNNYKNEKQANDSFIKYDSKCSNHFYYISNNKKKNSNNNIINSTKNKNNQSKIIKNVISKLINKKNEKKLNNQNTNNKKENRLFEMLNNALNEVNKKIKYINKKEESYLKNSKKINHEKSKTPSIKNIKKNDIFSNFNINNINNINNNINNNNINYNINNDINNNFNNNFNNSNNINYININSKNEIIDYSNNKININQNQLYLQKNFNTEEKFFIKDQKEINNIEEKNISNKDNNHKIAIINKDDKNIFDKDNKNINSNININKQKKIFDIQEFADNLNNYVHKYKTLELNKINIGNDNHNVNLIRNNNNNPFDINNNKIAHTNNDDEEEINKNMNENKNKIFEISINKLDNSIINNNKFINNNINININNINNSNNSTTNENNNTILNSIMNFKIINNDSDIHININNNNSTLNSINSNKGNKISIDNNINNSNIKLNNNNNNNILNNISTDDEKERVLYSEEENSEEQNETVQEIKESKINTQNNNINYDNNINKFKNININEYKNKLIDEKNTLKKSISKIKDEIMALIGGADYNYIMNLYNNTDNENENVDDIYEKIEKFVNLHYDAQKKEKFDNLYYLLIALDCQLVEKEKELKLII